MRRGIPSAGGAGILLLHYVVRGKGIFRRGKREYALQAGEIFVIRPGEVTYYEADMRDPWEYMWVAFDGFDVLEILRRTGLVNRYVVAVENGEEFARYLREMIASVQAQTYPHWELVPCKWQPGRGTAQKAPGGVCGGRSAYLCEAAE